MLSKPEKAVLRGTIFKHLDGIATAPTALSLHKKGVLQYLLEHKKVKLSTLAEQFGANTGYLNVALRILSSQGWLVQHLDNDANTVFYETNDNSQEAFGLAHLYEEGVKLLSHSVAFPDEDITTEGFSALKKNFKAFKTAFGLKSVEKSAVEQQILSHVEGLIVAPIVVFLGVNGLFHQYFMEASFRAEEYHQDPENFRDILDFLVHLGWFSKKKDTYSFTEKGLFFAKRSSAYGVTVSYLPTFLKLDELIFGHPLVLKTTSIDEPEKHVNREINVWGSGGAHATYFKVIDDIIIDLFNKPIDEQPKGILDMGCGNGAFIEHVFDVIERQTLRGKQLEQHPLLLVGADFNRAALKVTRANLIKADIWAKVIWGDIGNPNLLAKDLKEDYGIELRDLLNVRTFLDHNRLWEPPKTTIDKVSQSSGAYAHNGQRLNNNAVEASLLEHLKKWKPYVGRFGLLLIELHTIPPQTTAQNLGKTPATAYDATHGYSDQYIVEIDTFTTIAKAAGLQPNSKHFSKFPNNELATVSVNLLEESKTS